MHYSQNEKIIIWLDFFDFLTVERKNIILSCYDEPKEIFSSFKNDYNKFSKFLSKEQFDEMLKTLDEKFIDNEIMSYDLQKIKVLTFMSKDYPQEFLNYKHFPLALYCKGDVGLINSISVAVVGTRKITKYGKFATEKICNGLAQNNITIVSGMAEGVDTVAHKTALDNKTKTIAVIGGGFNNIFPKSNFELYQKICENGLVISEYRPDVLPLAHHFPVRNRIIAMLSKAVVMTEAGLKSGAIYTINYAIEYGKEIFAVPGNIDNFGSQGCNQILKKCQAGLVTCPEDILESLRIENKIEKQTTNIQVGMEEQILLDIIGNDELSFDELIEKTKFDTKTLVRLLTTLEISGIIKKSVGNFYSRILND